MTTPEESPHSAARGGRALSPTLGGLIEQARTGGERESSSSLSDCATAWSSTHRSTLKPARQDRLDDLLLTVIKPRWHGIALSDVTSEDVDSWLCELRRRPQPRRLTTSVLRDTQALLTSGLWMAVISWALDEAVEVMTTVVPVWTARGLRLNIGYGSGLGYAIGQSLGRIHARQGGGLSSTLPEVQRSWLVVTRTRVALVPSHPPAVVAWHIARSEIHEMQIRPRLQLLSSFRIRFRDGSSGSFLSPLPRSSLVRIKDGLGW